jgi:hypothetical protein
MADVGDVVGRLVEPSGDSDTNVLQVKVEIADANDIRSADVFRPAGVDTSPRDGARALILTIGKSWQIAVGFDDESPSEVAAGDMEIYALDSSGNRQGKVRCKADGQVVVNGGSGTAVEFSRLQTAFDQLKSDVNKFINSEYSLHNHPTAPVGPVSPPSIIGTPSTADITPAESSTVNLP